jgi:uncharacterized protein YjbJ (UPF0337 family)
MTLGNMRANGVRSLDLSCWQCHHPGGPASPTCKIQLRRPRAPQRSPSSAALGTLARPFALSVHPHIKECAMDWNRVEGNWKQVKGNVKEKWGKLTDDDLNVINGRRDQLEGKIQERYGIAKDQTRKDIDDWYSAQKW